MHKVYGVLIFEELVKSDSGIGDEIRRYQDMLQYASSKVDFNVRKVYMLRVIWFLTMGDRTGFNNKILVSEHGFKIGVNKLVNLVSVPTAASKMAAPKEVSNKVRSI